MARPLAALPKAHLHLHFTGAMRHATLVELARERRVHLPDALVSGWPPQLSGTDERGWFRFQRLYDIARSVLREPADVFRLLAETAADERAEGSGWLEIQVDPSGYAARFGGLTPTVELVLEAAAAAQAATGVGIGVIIAANRTKHPLEARTLARLAVQYAGRGVTGFGLFVTIDDPFVEGLIRIDALSDDYYTFDEPASRLVGSRSGKAFALGDAVRLKVQSVSVVRRKIDFALADHVARHRARDFQRGDKRRRDRKPERAKPGSHRPGRSERQEKGGERRNRPRGKPKKRR